MRAAPSRQVDSEPGRVFRALHARGIGWVVLAIYATAALAAWLVSLSSDGILGSAPVDRRQTILSEIQSANLITWVMLLGFATIVAILLLWLLGGWMRVADRVSSNLSALIAPRDAADSQNVRELAATFETTREQVEATTHAVAIRLRAFSQRAQSLASSIAEITRDTTAMKKGIEQLLDDGEAATADAALNHNRFSETSLSLHADLESLASRTEEASSAALEAAAHSDEVTESLHRFVGSFDAGAVIVEEAATEARTVAQKFGEFDAGARESQAEMKELASRLGQFESQLSDASRAAERLSTDMAQVVASFHQSVSDVEKLQVVASASTVAVSQLGQKIGQITRALSVINEVGEETNLLALNAAIIAAQAGEHGRAFSVVADEIKDLAERVGTSTREIAALVKATVAESGGASRTIEQGLASVQAAVGASHRVEAQLASLKVSAEGGADNLRAVLTQAGDEARKAGNLSSALGRVTAAAEELANVSKGLVETTARAVQSDEGVRPMASELVRAANDEVRNAKQVVRAVEKLIELSRRLALVKAEQAKHSALVQTSTARARTAMTECRKLPAFVDQVLSRVDRMSADLSRAERVLPASSEKAAGER